MKNKKTALVPGFFIQINEKGGKHFRKYTEDSLQILFDTSPSAANFELMILIEGLVFLALRTHFIIAGKEGDYEKFLKKDDRVKKAIDKLVSEHIIEEGLKKKLNEYRGMRNEIAHNAYRMKSFKSKVFPSFKEYSYTDAFEALFHKGMEIFREFSKFMVPGKPSKLAYIKRFRGVTENEASKTGK